MSLFYFVHLNMCVKCEMACVWVAIHNWICMIWCIIGTVCVHLFHGQCICVRLCAIFAVNGNYLARSCSYHCSGDHVFMCWMYIIIVQHPIFFLIVCARCTLCMCIHLEPICLKCQKKKFIIMIVLKACDSVVFVSKSMLLSSMCVAWAVLVIWSGHTNIKFH